MSANQLTLWYLVASVCFILALKGLSTPATARRGNALGIAGMTLAILFTAALIWNGRIELIVMAMLVGGTLGAIVARRVQMTQMPELVAAMHSLVGMAAVLIAVAAVNNPGAFGEADPMPKGNKLELCIGTFVGAITFSGSVIAFGKLAGLGKKFRLFSSAPVAFPAQHWLNLLLSLVMVGAGAVFFMADEKAWMPFLVMTASAFVLGVLIGSSGAILSYIMCKAMNRSFVSVILGGFGAAEGAAAAGTGQKTVRAGSADDAAFLMTNAENVIIVPGYGLAVARAQHAVKEMAAKLAHKGVNVRYAIHPVAGRMPGHMNVLLAEAEVPYDQVFEMEDINSEFGSTDVVLVLGANDVVNPLAHEKGSAIYGMPILEAYKAKTVIVNKRSMAAGYAGLDNPLFYMDKTMMVFGDAKKVVEDILKALE